jgi:hypothetical protein
MSDMLSETAACTLLARLFRGRGYAIERNVMFHEYGVSFHIDGWDAKARVGFEYLTSEDDDHDDLSLVEYEALMAEQKRGGLSLFIIDEVEPVSADDLTDAANDFLDEVEASRKAARRPRAGKAAARRPAAKRPAGRAKKASKRSRPGRRR